MAKTLFEMWQEQADTIGGLPRNRPESAAKAKSGGNEAAFGALSPATMGILQKINAGDSGGAEVMTADIYDPTGIKRDAFKHDNHYGDRLVVGPLEIEKVIAEDRYASVWVSTVEGREAGLICATANAEGNHGGNIYVVTDKDNSLIAMKHGDEAKEIETNFTIHLTDAGARLEINRKIGKKGQVLGVIDDEGHIGWVDMPKA